MVAAAEAGWAHHPVAAWCFVRRRSAYNVHKKPGGASVNRILLLKVFILIHIELIIIINIRVIIITYKSIILVEKRPLKLMKIEGSGVAVLNYWFHSSNL